jgi:hypothetical protein
VADPCNGSDFQSVTDDPSRRIGVAAGKYRLPENFDEPDDDIVALFEGVDS